jgi:hypothetical protein
VICDSGYAHRRPLVLVREDSSGAPAIAKRARSSSPRGPAGETRRGIRGDGQAPLLRHHGGEGRPRLSQLLRRRMMCRGLVGAGPTPLERAGRRPCGGLANVRIQQVFLNESNSQVRRYPEQPGRSETRHSGGHHGAASPGGHHGPAAGRAARGDRAQAPPAHPRPALLTLGVAGALRRSELVTIDVGDLRPDGDHGLVVLLRTSKTDQEGRGDEIAIPAGPTPTPARYAPADVAGRRRPRRPGGRAGVPVGRPARQPARPTERGLPSARSSSAAPRAGSDRTSFSGHPRAGLATAPPSHSP